MQIALKQPSEPAKTRMNALAVLPVFFSLRGKRALVIGGSDAAAWKAELLASAGARVEVLAFSGEISEEMLALASNGAGAGQVHLVDANWRERDFAGAAIVVADIHDDDAPELIAIARAAGVPVNVIDKPNWCDFQFGSIVNRSPVVVGISTDGAAPILGQAVRRRIETLLPTSLGAWGALARQVRENVMARLKPGAERRAFWERFVDLSFRSTPVSEDDLNMAVDQAAKRAGHVTLVGAGPGDAELLTLKAMRALQSADVILFDDLVSAEVLELARREAKRLCVGKRGGRESCRQDDINSMMLSFARQGKHVVRLKSGDPMIFGRAGEEAAMLEANGISVSFVPGISAAQAFASRLGVSLTHRDHAQSVRLVTGHSRQGNLPETLDWEAIARGDTTSVFYMCRSTLPQIAERLLRAGMDSDTPICIAANVCRPNEKLLHGVLANAHELAAQLSSDDVCLMAIGDVLRTRSVASEADGAKSPVAQFA